MAAPASTTMTSGAESQRIGLTGWGIFAAATLIVLGAVNLVNGFTAIQHSSYYRSDIVYNNFTFWGWMFLIWGALQLVAGVLVFARSTAGYFLGVSLALVAAMLLLVEARARVLVIASGPPLFSPPLLGTRLPLADLVVESGDGDVAIRIVEARDDARERRRRVHHRAAIAARMQVLRWPLDVELEIGEPAQ